MNILYFILFTFSILSAPIELDFSQDCCDEKKKESCEANCSLVPINKVNTEIVFYHITQDYDELLLPNMLYSTIKYGIISSEMKVQVGGQSKFIGETDIIKWLSRYIFYH